MAHESSARDGQAAEGHRAEGRDASVESTVHTSGFYRRTLDEPHAARLVDPALLERLEQLAVAALGSLGVASRVLFESTLAAVTDHTDRAGRVPESRWIELVGRLASEIADEQVRDRFVSEALLLPVRSRHAGALEQLSPVARWVVERRQTR